MPVNKEIIENKLFNNQNKVARGVNKFLGNHAMEGPRCCFVMPMRPGIVFISIYCVMDLLQSSMLTFTTWETTNVIFIMNAIALIPIYICNFIFMKYLFTTDSYESRSTLIMGCGLMILAQLIQYASVLYGFLFTNNVNFNTLVFNFGINALQIMSYSYFLFVC